MIIPCDYSANMILPCGESVWSIRASRIQTSKCTGCMEHIHVYSAAYKSQVHTALLGVH